MTRPYDWRSPYHERLHRDDRDVLTWREMLAARRVIRRVQNAAAIAERELRAYRGADRHERTRTTIELDGVLRILAADERTVMAELVEQWRRAGRLPREPLPCSR